MVPDPIMPTLRTSRLVLSPFTQEDSDQVQRILSVREVAMDILRLPYPYPEGEAAKWISTHKEEFDVRGKLFLAIRKVADGQLLGSMSLSVNRLDDRGSIGYWLDRSCWGFGYATEAASAVLEYAFEVLDLNKVSAECFSRNLESTTVMKKLGMTNEGHKRQHYNKWGEFLDSEEYGIVRSDWERLMSEGKE